MRQVKALIADDEPLLRERLRTHLAALWPDLTLTDDARNGAETLELYALHRPDIVFLDIHMPGLSGIDTARALARRAHLVFVTAYEQYAVQAFEQGAVDYLVKPIDQARLADTVERLQRQLPAPIHGNAAMETMLGQLTARLGQRVEAPGRWLQWIKASVGNSLRLIPVDQVHYLRADEKYEGRMGRRGSTYPKNDPGTDGSIGSRTICSNASFRHRQSCLCSRSSKGNQRDGRPAHAQ